MASADKSGSTMTADGNDLQSQVETLRNEVRKLTEHLERAGDASVKALRKAAVAGVDQLKTQGEAAYDGLRANAREVEDQFYTHVREKPATSIALALTAGYLIAVLARR